MRGALLTGLSLLAVLLAGCSDDADAAAGGADDLQSTPTTDDAAEPVYETVTRTLVERTSWNGTTKEGAFVCTNQDGTGSCPAGSQVLPDGQHTTTLPYAGNFSEALLTVTWTPADATQTGLVLAVYDPAGGLVGTVSGTSGSMEFAVPASDALSPDGSLALAAWPQSKAPAGPGVFVDVTRQPFQVVAEVVTTAEETVEVVPAEA